MNPVRCYGCMAQLSDPGRKCPRCGYDNERDPARQAAEALACGTKLYGKYVIGKVLGRGGFGMTYIGWDEALKIRICIKEYFPECDALRGNPRSGAVYWRCGEKSASKGRNTFIHEAHKTAMLRDLRSIVKVWDVFAANNTAYIVMDYIEGVTLKQYLQETGHTWTEEECVRFLRPVIDDLSEVHKRKIIHRDISPDNLMRRTDGTLILLDLGAALDLSRVSSQSEEQIAKKGFSPIEQYTKRSRIGPWTDVYAMCATIVYCVTGKCPPAPLERYNGQETDLSAFSPRFAEVLKHGLAIEPDKRIASMAELLRELNAASEKPRINRKNALLTAGVFLIAAVLIFAEGRSRRANTASIGESAVISIAKPTASAVLSPAPLPEPEGMSEAEAENCYRRGREFEETGKFEEAMEAYREASQAGNRDAMFRLGFFYFSGFVAAPDYAKALECYQAAAEQGSDDAMLEIGLMYCKGIGGLSQDYGKAMEYFLRAESLGNGEAMFQIGNLYYYGYGVEANEQKARLWWDKAENTLGQVLILPVS